MDNQPMTSDELACKMACHDVLVRFCAALDGDDGTLAADFFADDATMLTPTGDTVQGAGVRAALAKRPTAAIATRHIMTNVLIEPTGADSAKATATIVVYRVPRQDPDVSPRALPATPQGIGEWSLELAKTAQGWKLSHYGGAMVLEPAKG